MATNFPTSLDTLTNPISTDTQNSPSHAGQHSDANDAVEALQTKVGVDSSAVTTSLDYLLKDSGSEDPGHLHTASGIATAAKTGIDTDLVTGTAGTSGNTAQWNADGDLVDGKALPTGAIVGTTDTQTLTNKTLADPIIDIGYQTASDGATVTFDLGSGAYTKHKVTLGGNRTLALSNELVGQAFVIDLIQDATGSRTVTWFSTIKWASGSAPTLTTNANAIDTFGFVVTSAGNYQGYVVGQDVS